MSKLGEAEPSVQSLFLRKNFCNSGQKVPNELRRRILGKQGI